MTTPITRLARDTIKACEGFKNAEDESFYYDYPNSAQALAKIVLEMDEAIRLTIARAGDYGDSHLSKPVREVLARCQQIASEGRDG